MPYVQEICKAGKTIEVRKYFSSRYGKRSAAVRKEASAVTSEDMEAVNERNAVKKLRRILNTNFEKNDIHLVLTYRKADRPGRDEARRRLSVFMRRMKKVCEKIGKEWMYVSVTEYENTAIHHHLVIKNIDVTLVQDCWEWGKARPTYLDDSGDYAALAEYLVKETKKSFRSGKAVYRKRWNASQNLKKPEIIKKVITANEWKKVPKAKAGYYIKKDSLKDGVVEKTGYRYQEYVMIRLFDT